MDNYGNRDADHTGSQSPHDIGRIPMACWGGGAIGDRMSCTDASESGVLSKTRNSKSDHTPT
jgi:hypothetical protein